MVYCIYCQPFPAKRMACITMGRFAASYIQYKNKAESFEIVLLLWH